MTTSYSTKQMDSKKLKKDLVLSQLQETRKDIMYGRIQLHEINDNLEEFMTKVKKMQNRYYKNK